MDAILTVLVLFLLRLVLPVALLLLAGTWLGRSQLPRREA